jgi:hypothetical protein
MTQRYRESMASPKGRLLAATFVLFLEGPLAGATMADASFPSLDSPELAQGPFAYMHMLLQKTILSINVATIEVRVDKPTQSRLAGIASGQQYSDALGQQLANVAIGAERAVVQMRFKRDISLNRWMGVVRENLEQARKAGLINADLERQVGQGLPQWFAALKDRGYEKNDRLVYAVGPDSLRTAVVSAGGQVLVDRADREQGTRRVILASYFAYGSEFREPLLRSLFQPQP